MNWDGYDITFDHTQNIVLVTFKHNISPFYYSSIPDTLKNFPNDFKKLYITNENRILEQDKFNLQFEIFNKIGEFPIVKTKSPIFDEKEFILRLKW